MAGAMRFSTTELAELDARIATAADRALALELAVFAQLAARCSRRPPAIRAAADALALIDVDVRRSPNSPPRAELDPAGGRRLARLRDRGRPASGGRGGAEGARRRASSPTTATCRADGRRRGGGRIAVVTGPNMAGKSTFLRQNALIADPGPDRLLCAGRRGPASASSTGCSRASGRPTTSPAGRSTFMVEMVETAAILNQATPRSLVILDEIGRGTATFDGLAIAWAAIEHLHEQNRSRALFATHFHELTLLGATLPRLRNLTMRVTDWNGELVFLHEVVPGAADRSYGIQVAKLAGLPPPVVERARVLLAEFEASARAAHVPGSATCRCSPPARRRPPLRRRTRCARARRPRPGRPVAPRGARGALCPEAGPREAGPPAPTRLSADRAASLVLHPGAPERHLGKCRPIEFGVPMRDGIQEVVAQQAGERHGDMRAPPEASARPTSLAPRRSLKAAGSYWPSAMKPP